MKKIQTSFAVLIGVIILVTMVSPALAAEPQISMAPKTLTADSSQSTNWSGYAITGAAGSITSVSGSWIVPAVTGTSTAYAAFWTGIDGANSNTVEQTGTMSAIVNGQPTYYAWYEFYPAGMVEITTGSQYTVNPGDTISATVTYTGSSTITIGHGRHATTTTQSTFEISISDTPAGWTYTTTGTVNNAALSSAEWIAEAPSSQAGILPLANFGTVQFGSSNTGISSTCYATTTASGSQPIGDFGSAIQTISMVTITGHGRHQTITTIATPSGLTDKDSFIISQP